MKRNYEEFKALEADIYDNYVMGFITEDEMNAQIAELAIQQLPKNNDPCFVISINQLKTWRDSLASAPHTPERQEIVDTMNWMLFQTK